MDTHMERTQIYLPASLKKRIKRHAQLSHSNVSEILRLGAEMVLSQQMEEERKKKVRKALKNIAGMWKDRDDIDFETIRRKGTRIFPGWND